MSSAQDAHPHGRVPRQRSAQAEISSGELTVAGRRLGSIGPGAVEVDGRTVSPESAPPRAMADSKTHGWRRCIERSLPGLRRSVFIVLCLLVVLWLGLRT